jgi:putative Mg2+ transporter-C (MgtC) family protein
MEELGHIDTTALLNTVAGLIAAFVLGGIIGLERQVRQRTAGLRTNVLVAVGAAIFVDIAARLSGHEGAVRVVAYVVSGIGFLGAGAIMREEGSVRGLNTAATLWGSAAVGACSGAGLLLEATIASLFVLSANTLLRPIVNRINRQPLDVETAEVTNTIYVIASRDKKREALQLLEKLLDKANHPLNDLTIHAFGANEVEIEAQLVATSVDGDELDKLTQQLAAEPFISQAFWSPSTTD